MRAGSEVERELKAVEVLLQVLVIGVAVIEGALSRELFLDKQLQARPYSVSDDLGGFHIEVTAKPWKWALSKTT